MIGANLQKQYERWQPRARYKQSLDPTVEEIKRLCTSLRRNAKEERVLFHYNGHGVPSPTTNGEIWVFNSNYTQYIPLSIYDLQSWMGAPSIYVYDCSNAGIIVNSFDTFADQHEREMDQLQKPSGETNNAIQNPDNQVPVSYKNCIQLAACSENQILPMNPNLPADLFTACLTTPIKMALKWYTLQQTSKLTAPHITCDLIERIPGQLNDRRTMLGELNWIFTAITDTIAWNTLSRDLFQKLFRQDLLVASLFRNYLLAERILRSYDCVPVSNPSLPPSFRHPMWAAWDLALDSALSQLPDIVERNVTFEHSKFFEAQLTAFQVWLEGSREKRRDAPEQLPIVLQVLLSQVHRSRALDLLGRFLDLGPWAVNLALSVGIFPYVLRLLQSSDKDLRPCLIFIWAKILAVDSSCQFDLVRDQGLKYFLSALQEQELYSHRTYAAFVLSCIVHNFPSAQKEAFQGSLLSICLEQIDDTNPKLRQWLTICLGHLWKNNTTIRWSGVRDLAHEKLYTLLQDTVPEVRAAACYALGTFMSAVTTDRSEHANNIDRSISMTLLCLGNDMSPIVRMELLASLQWIILLFENIFINLYVEDRQNHLLPSITSPISPSPTSSGFRFSSIYSKIWHCIQMLTYDPFEPVALLAQKIVNYIQNQSSNITESFGRTLSLNSGGSHSLPPSPRQPSVLEAQHKIKVSVPSAPVSNVLTPIIKTNYLEWSTSYFTRYAPSPATHPDKNSQEFITRQSGYKRNRQIRDDAEIDPHNLRFEQQVFVGRAQSVPHLVRLHPYNTKILLAYNDKVMLHDYDNQVNLTNTFSPKRNLMLPMFSRVRSIDFINPEDIRTLILVCYSDGVLRIWGNNSSSCSSDVGSTSGHSDGYGEGDSSGASASNYNSSIASASANNTNANGSLITSFNGLHDVNSSNSRSSCKYI